MKRTVGEMHRAIKLNKKYGFRAIKNQENTSKRLRFLIRKSNTQIEREIK